nr:hypothetical protein [Tanacetum cinerariifolium]
MAVNDGAPLPSGGAVTPVGMVGGDAGLELGDDVGGHGSLGVIYGGVGVVVGGGDVGVIGVVDGGVALVEGGILHGLPIEPGFVKVQVDSVEEGCSAFPVARPTDEVKTLHDALGGQFIQWPRKYMRVSKKISSHKSISQLSSNGPSRYQPA